MRISTSLMYRQVTDSLLNQEAQMGRLVEKMSTGRRILTPADDPLGASMSVNVAQTLALNQTYASNRASAEQKLNLQERALGAVGTALQDVLTRAVEAGNGTFSNSDRLTLSNVLAGTRDALVGLANTTDGNGHHVFSGFDGDRAPYDAKGAYQIDPSRNQSPAIQVDQSRVLAVGEVGSNIFARANPGTGGHIVSAELAEGSTARFGAVGYTGPGSAHASRDVVFSQEAGGLSYRVSIDGQAGPARAYVAGEPLQLGDGMTLAISGQPAAGDRFAVNRTEEAGVDIFGALNALIDGLAVPIERDPAAAAAFANTLATATQVLQNGYDNVLTVRSAVGSSLQEIDALDAVGVDRELAYTKELSSIEDANTITLLSELTQRQTSLQAAGLAFQAIQGINLFNRS